VDKRLAGYALKRTARLRDGIVTVETSNRSLGREFPAAEAARAEAELRQLAQHSIVLRVVNPAPAVEASSVATAGREPTDAAGFARRGATRVFNSDLKGAIADLTRAVELDPKSSRYLYDRGVARLRNDEEKAALADFEAALRLKPDDELALMARGQLRLLNKQDALAAADFDAALMATSDRRGLLERIASVYENEGRFEQAVRHLDVLLDGVTDASVKAAVLNQRCWAKAQWGRELESALADCEASLKLRPDAPETLDSRGLIRLRQGRWADAVADYDKALAIRPAQAASLYGRGLARARSGAKAAGAADVAEAVRLAPEVASIYTAVGLKP
jgi:tetratricopeptide (TPR) repeat protein